MSTWIKQKQTQVEVALEASFARAEANCGDPTLLAAMRYAVLGGGKRARALLVYAASELTSNSDPLLVDACAVAVELIHAYSLVHDDLPAIDNDAMRRGKPSTHIAFGEAMGLLAGDALQTMAFEVLSQCDAAATLTCVRHLATASGQVGMAGGQALDLAATAKVLTEGELENIHRRKTGALISASVAMGAACAGLSVPPLEAYARAIGLAFQVQDDILDATADSATLGKTAGKDAAQEKTTYVTLLGLAGARSKLAALTLEANTAFLQLPTPQSQALAAVHTFLNARQS